ncbi:uncharacterized protein BJX67DRAFT_382984 [Aspergillus lucknowensis]|uniref:Mid2 domain-containing protein n=1 Tax=Aspergillus lucknowensis TaxID=176173 RepID=A0ABR4LPC2_9EURO
MISSLVLLAVAANAITPQTPQATVAQATKTATRIEPTPAPSSVRERLHLSRRDDTTSQAEASVCGYYERSKNSRLGCQYGNACAFYSADSQFPGMVGCCATSSTTAPCTIYSTCYNSAEVSATPALTEDEMALRCTYDSEQWCHTRTWPALNVADFGCTDTSSSWVETMYTYGTLYDEEDDEEDQITETLSLSWLSRSDLPTARAVSATTTSETESTTTPTVSGPPGDAAGGDAGDGSDDDSGSSTPVGAIVGGVVGGVGGLALIAGAFFLLRRRKKKNAIAAIPLQEGKWPDVAPSELSAPIGPTRHEMMADPLYAELPTQAPRVERHEME